MKTVTFTAPIDPRRRYRQIGKHDCASNRDCYHGLCHVVKVFQSTGRALLRNKAGHVAAFDRQDICEAE